MPRKATPINGESRTVMADERVAGLGWGSTPSPEGKGKDYFLGRPKIGRDTRINGGVYIGASAREAIVVDDEKHPRLADAYELLKDDLLKAQRKSKVAAWLLGHKMPTTLDPFTATKAAYQYTQQLMPTDPKAVKEIVRGEKDRKVSLTSFLGRGGVCRHHALLNAYFVEKMIDEGLLNGEVHVERNTAIEGAHAWARFTPERGDSIIMDSTQNFVGTPTQAQEDAVFWVYEPTPIQ